MAHASARPSAFMAMQSGTATVQRRSASHGSAALQVGASSPRPTAQMAPSTTPPASTSPAQGTVQRCTATVRKALDWRIAANSVMQGGGRNTQAVHKRPTAPSSASVRASLNMAWTRLTTGVKTTPTVHDGTVYDTHRTVSFCSPQKMPDGVLSDALQLGPAVAWTAYQAMSVADKGAFDRAVGINNDATPGVGEVYSTVANKDEAIDQGVWNFHRAGVVMKSGGDTVTVENLAGSGATAWDFQMSGPANKAGQSFHAQQSSRTKHDGVTPDYGDHPTTLRVQAAP